MKVPMFDLKIKNKNFKKEIFTKFNNFLDQGYFFMGNSVLEFEKITKKFLKAKYTLGVSSGSSAIYLALKSQGIKKGDEVITTPLTWIIPVNAIAACGATPVFADVDDNFNIDPNSIISKITKKTKAILPMHFAGKLCDMDLISKIAKKYKLKIIEDCAQSYYAKINGKNAGSFSNSAGFSMNPMKPFGGVGEAGLVTTNNYKTYLLLKKLRHAGTSSDPSKKITNNCISVSLNHKIDEINAFMLVLMHKNLKQKIDRCNQIANLYKKELDEKILHQVINKNEIHGRYVYPIICKKRNKLMNFLKSNNIETKIFNQPLCYDAPVYKKFKKQKLKNAERLMKNHLIIPCHENMNNSQVQYVIEKINNFYKFS